MAYFTTHVQIDRSELKIEIPEKSKGCNSYKLSDAWITLKVKTMHIKYIITVFQKY
jgi:hypothetical protein